MWYLSVALLLLTLLFPWMYRPLRRTFHQEGVGHIVERNFLGFWVSLGNLSDRLNKLENDKVKAQKKLKKLTMLIENEQAALNRKTTVINDEYRTFLYDWGGKRHWMYLLRKVPVPSFAFVAPVEQKRKENKRRREVFLLSDCTSLPEDLRTTGVKVWRYDDKFPKGQRKKSPGKTKEVVSKTTTVKYDN